MEATRGSFDDVREAIRRHTGQRLGKRQLEALVQRATTDFDAFYEERKLTAGHPDDVLVISCDGKGVVMRPDALRAATAQAAARSTNKLATRLSKGEKRNRKRVAEVGSVYDAVLVPRTPDDIMPGSNDRDRAPAPAARNKWLVASVVEDAATVVGRVFDEAERRDPDHRRTWIALVDGNNHQIDRIQAQASARQVDVTIVVDFVHVLEYLSKAAWCFHDEGDPNAERWVRDRARAVLKGQAAGVAAAIRRKATRERLDRAARATIDACAAYLADRHRCHRGCLSAPRQGPHGHHRRPLGPRRCRSRPQDARRRQQRRLPRVLAIPRRERARPRPPFPLCLPRPSLLRAVVVDGPGAEDDVREHGRVQAGLDAGRLLGHHRRGPEPGVEAAVGLREEGAQDP